ncbi:hypothetical protein CP556_20575 [Natrinema sp. CBA1119]|uniref:hypothetical protein n=1 Tax=Natrinema sp. CBA1119 TaxID=1608465 RepID=UPI000BF99CD5|nr:hypothetical protein [Natrinema sp. CBA1119]PGF14511.1 hypothetical protein CP556_20575 [Natrinema sp. CBA1119]
MADDEVNITRDGTADETTIQWRWDASTSRTVRLLWAFGVGTFFAAIVTVICWRLYRMAGEVAGGFGRAVVIALIIALAATVLALAASSDTERHLKRITRQLPINVPSETSLDRAMDAAVGTVVMGVIIGMLMGIGRYVSQNELLAVGAGPFTGLAALLLPLALVALVLASFLQSVGALDYGEQIIYLYEPEQTIDLAVIEAVSTRQFGDVVVVKLSYAQPDNQYIQGPRRIVVPPEVAHKLQSPIEHRTA